jgi:DNA-binding MarR family transcriptional regulator
VALSISSDSDADADAPGHSAPSNPSATAGSKAPGDAPTVEELVAGTAARGREQLTDDLLEALTAWNPTERLSAFKTWQRRALSLIHLQVITILELQGPLAMNRLAELTGVSVASATGIVARMEGRHLVERRHDDSDRRLVLVALTSTGKRMFRVIEQRRRAHLRKILRQLSEDELAAFLIGLRAVKAAAAAMSAAARDAAPPASGRAAHQAKVTE